MQWRYNREIGDWRLEARGWRLVEIQWRYIEETRD
jgi:hypothetical protein